MRHSITEQTCTRRDVSDGTVRLIPRGRDGRVGSAGIIKKPARIIFERALLIGFAQKVIQPYVSKRAGPFLTMTTNLVP
jgi:hypothetical protein